LTNLAETYINMVMGIEQKKSNPRLLCINTFRGGFYS
jgi:hypothetical protein